MTTLEAVLFDVDDTLFSTTRFARAARRNAVRAMIDAGLNLPEDEVFKELEEVIREFGSNHEHHYDKLLMRLPPEALEAGNPVLVVASGVVGYHDTKFRELEPFDDVKPFLRALADAGVRAGVVTHGRTAKQAEKLIRLGLLELLDPRAVLISDQVGISKPNPKLYALALHIMELEPAQAMYVGDNLRNDVAPPLSLGMPAVWARRGAREQRGVDDVTPTHTVDDFRELGEVLRQEYGVDLARF